MSLLLSLGNPYETATPIVFGDGLQAVRYDMSNVTLPPREPIFGAIVTHTTDVIVPVKLFLVPDSFRWQSPDNGLVVWDCVPVLGPPPGPPASVPEPAYGSWLGILLLIAVSLFCLQRSDRKKWGGE